MLKERVPNKAKATHETPSGLGGVFSVIVRGETTIEGKPAVKVQVINKQSDFHGCVFSVKPEELTVKPGS